MIQYKYSLTPEVQNVAIKFEVLRGGKVIYGDTINMQPRMFRNLKEDELKAMILSRVSPKLAVRGNKHLRPGQLYNLIARDEL